MQQSQGKRANTNGRMAEHVIADILTRRGHGFHRQFLVGRGVFDTDIYADFMIPTLPLFPSGLIIESKWQEVAGSAEEKLCYLVENIHACYPCPVIIVIDGGGFRTGAVRWLRAQAGQGRLFAVLNLGEFLSWCNRNL